MAMGEYHYQMITRAMRIIDESPDPDMPLATLAARMHMSPAHFQRVFSRWVGISPKRYQQYLQLGTARTLLRDDTSVLDTAHTLGLSGAGRLHDMFIRWEAMSPGEYARGGEGLTLCHGRFDSPFGPMLAMGTERGLCGLAFLGERDMETVHRDLAGHWPRARFEPNENTLEAWVDGLFARRNEVRFLVAGGPFQIKVWEALLAIPLATTVSYSVIATAIGNPRAVRATATAVGDNPLAWLIPCHRVIRKSGALGGYRWGLDVKRSMLAWEAARAEALDAGDQFKLDSRSASD